MRYRLLLLAACLTACVSAPSATSAPPTLPPPVVIIITPTPPRATSPLVSAPTDTPPLPPTLTAAPTLTPIPLPSPDAQAVARQIRLPILMYHYIEPWPADADTLRKNLTVRPEDFAAHMQYLHDNGYTAVSLYDLTYALALGWPLPEKSVALTFDDGYRTLMDYAVPVMNQYDYKGTVFVITELMDREFPAYLTWPQAEQLYADGWKIEPHTKTHENLQGRDRDFQLYQMLGSMQTIEAHIGTQPRYFNYPAGKYDALSVQLAGEMNLWGAVTVEFGRMHTFDNRYTWSRVRVEGQGTLAEFVARLEGNP